MDKYRDNSSSQAIVLYVHQDDTHRVVLLDAHHGKILCYIPKRELVAGVIIEYQLIKKRRYFVAYAVNITHMPFAVVHRDIYFLHHVLELCFYFLPEEQEAPEIFALVRYLSTHGNMVEDTLPKKLYLSKLFILFGIYPEKPYIESNYWQLLLASSIETILQSCRNLTIEPALGVWLLSCMQTHPLYRAFKTVHCIDHKE